MNVIDIGIVIFILFGAVIGFKRGFTRQLLHSVGFILIVYLAFKLRAPVSVLLFKNLPFFKFGGLLKGAEVLNIIVYEFIAFIIVLGLLTLLLKLVVMASKVFEKFLTMTIILGIPSKIIGALIGLVEHYVIAFIILYVLTLPFFNTSFVEGSKYKDKILNNTPILSNVIENTLDAMKDLGGLKDKFEVEKDVNQFNLEALDLLLKKKIVNVESVDELVSKNKLTIDNIEFILQKYR